MGVYFDFKEAELTSYGGKDSHLHHTYTIKNLPKHDEKYDFCFKLTDNHSQYTWNIYVKSLFEKMYFYIEKLMNQVGIFDGQLHYFIGRAIF